MIFADVTVTMSEVISAFSLRAKQGEKLAIFDDQIVVDRWYFHLKCTEE